MNRNLVREFEVNSTRDAFLAVAQRPLLGPHYLNFLTKIEPRHVVAQPHMPVDWQLFFVWVNYRSILKTQSVVAYRFDVASSCVFLRHDGNLAAFEAQFEIGQGRVRLECIYNAKNALVSWLIATALDRALGQISGAMDRYAATLDAAPT
jgi:hypothetical protein